MSNRQLALAAALLVLLPGFAQARDRVSIGDFSIDRTEVTIGAFRRVLADRKTQAERDGGGFEYSGGWVRREGWTWSEPYGNAGQDMEPVVHVTWQEARDYCRKIGGRLPSFKEWKSAAYTENRTVPTNGFIRGQTYTYPVGNESTGMNNSRKRHVPSGTTKQGVIGLYDMGANIWEWLADRRGDDALTAGGSWWYGPQMTRAEGAQWKPTDF